MLNALIQDTSRTGTNELYTDVTLTQVGVMITVDRGSPDELEVLIPFGSGRVLEVSPDRAGELHDAFLYMTDNQP
jgi:hypothetical protein